MIGNSGDKIIAKLTNKSVIESYSVSLTYK